MARAANVLLPNEFYALPAAKRATAFTVSNLAKLDQIQAVANKMSEMQAAGSTFLDFQQWADGQEWTLPTHRLETIYRNAVQNSYQAGHWRAFSEQIESFPCLAYDAINDSRTRPSHLALDGVIKPVGDPFWSSHTPPLGHRCRCTLRSLSRRETMERGGVTQNPPAEGRPDKGWGSDPREWDSVLKRLGVEKAAKAPEAVQKAFEEIYTNSQHEKKVTSLRGLADGLLSSAKNDLPNIEYAGLLNENGKRLWTKRGGERHVSFTDQELSEMSNGILVHNHPSSTSLSGADLGLMRYCNMRRIYAVGADGSVYAAATTPRGANRVIVNYEFDRADKEVRKILVEKVATGEVSVADANQRHTHIVNLVLKKRKIIRYHASIKGGSPQWANDIARGIPI